MHAIIVVGVYMYICSSVVEFICSFAVIGVSTPMNLMNESSVHCN